MDVEYIGAGRYLAGVPATGMTAAEIAAGGWTAEALIASGCYRAAGQEPEAAAVGPECNTVLQPEEPEHPAPEPEADGPPVPPLALLDVWEDAEEATAEEPEQRAGRKRGKSDQ